MSLDDALLLDTCAAIYIVNREPLDPAALPALRHATAATGLFVSPVTGWEIGLLARQGRGAAIQLDTDPRHWLARLMAAPGIRPAALTAEIALESSLLPGDIHRDPADRMLIAIARALAIPIVTRDRLILAYAAQGHVRALPC